jgi:hypothetical protein
MLSKAKRQILVASSVCQKKKVRNAGLKKDIDRFVYHREPVLRITVSFDMQFRKAERVKDLRVGIKLGIHMDPR